MNGWIKGAIATSVVGASFPVSDALTDYSYAAGPADPLRDRRADPARTPEGPPRPAHAKGVRAAERDRRRRHGRLQPRGARRRRPHRRDQRGRDHRREPGPARPRHRPPPGAPRRARSSSRARRSSTAPTRTVTAPRRRCSRSPRSSAKSASRCSPRRCSPASARCASPPGPSVLATAQLAVLTTGDIPTPSATNVAAIALPRAHHHRTRVRALVQRRQAARQRPRRPARRLHADRRRHRRRPPQRPSAVHRGSRGDGARGHRDCGWELARDGLGHSCFVGELGQPVQLLAAGTSSTCPAASSSPAAAPPARSSRR